MASTPDTALHDLPYLTDEMNAIPAAIKRRYEDFRVTELPLYEPIDSGTHCFVRIEKTGLATMRAVNDIAGALGVSPRDIGVAGLKDARGVTVQTLSIEHVEPDRLRELEIPRIRILAVHRHRNRLKIGHLRGNRFEIRLREVDVGRLADIRTVCEVLTRRGVPNYFGPQRFGLRGDTWEMGRAAVKRDYQAVLDLMLGRAGPSDSGEVLRARQLYDTGDFEDAARVWPRGFQENTRACRAMAKSGGNAKRAFHAIDARLRRLYVNALQSHLFNRVLGARIAELDRVRDGDIAYKHDNGAAFLVEDAAREAERAARFEISATGPIYGPKMKSPAGEIAALESSVLSAGGLTLDELGSVAGVRLRGDRRPLRFGPNDLEIEAGTDDHGAFVELRFSLPPGCYATMLLRETCKDQLSEGLPERP